MTPKVNPADPRDLFFGLNDLATRIRTLGPEESCEWASISAYLDEYVEYFSSLTGGKGPRRKPLTGGMEQGAIVALDALKTAQREARAQLGGNTAAAIEQASRAIRHAGDLSLPSFASESNTAPRDPKEYPSRR